MAKSNDELLNTMRKDFHAAVSAEQDLRNRGKKSFDFFAGEQWSEEDKRVRDEENRPYFVFDKLSKFVYQLSGDMRQNMPESKTIPVQGAGFDEAQIMNEMLKYIDRESDAEDAKQMAALSQLNSGMGFWWYTVEDSKFEPNSKEIRVKRVSNRFTIYLDQRSNTYTYEDGRFAFISEMLPKKEFKEQYPSAKPIDFETALGDYDLDWHEDGKVRIAIYFYKKKKKIKIVKLFNPFTGEIHNTKIKGEVTEESLRKAGLVIVDSEEKELDQIMWCKVSGAEILEGPEVFPGEYIPIVPVIGHEIFKDGVRSNRSLIDSAIPAQEAYNYSTTKTIEISALQPLAPFVGTDKQVSNNPEVWANANRQNNAILTYTPDPLAPGPPQRQFPPQVSSALLSLSAQADSDIRDIIGRGLASLGQAQRERTGAAIEASKRSSDITTYTFFSNFLKSTVFGGRIALSMIPEVYDNERVIRIYGNDNQIADLTINETVRDPITGDEVIYNDLTQGKYDYVPISTIGQLTKRLEMKQALIDVMTIAPEMREAFIEEFVEVSDLPNKERIKQLLNQKVQQLQQQQATQAGQRGAPPQPRQAIVQ
jgi:hypothetical protein